MTETTDTTEVLLPKPPGVFRQFLVRHGRLVDIAILVVYVLANLSLIVLAGFDASGKTFVQSYRDEVLLGTSAYSWPDPVKTAFAIIGIIAIIACGAMLLWRRSRPLTALILVALLSLLPLGMPMGGIIVAGYFFLYAVPVYQSVFKGWVGFAVIAVATLLMTLISPPGTGGLRDILILTVTGILPNLIAVLIGINVGNRKRYVEAVVARARQLAVERDQRAKLAVASERSRISREMHDIVAHSLSVMIALSDGASRAVEQAPGEAADAMRSSASTGRQALTEMRRALGVLRDSQGAELASQPNANDLPALIAGFEDAGLNVAAHVSVQVADEGLGLAVYRIVQEALTNALRYAGIGARAEVRVSTAADTLHVMVRDYGTPQGMPAPPTGQGSGQGLIGLRERVRAFGGVLNSQPAPDRGGWIVEATMPMREAASDGAKDSTGARE